MRLCSPKIGDIWTYRGKADSDSYETVILVLRKDEEIFFCWDLTGNRKSIIAFNNPEMTYQLLISESQKP